MLWCFTTAACDWKSQITLKTVTANISSQTIKRQSHNAQLQQHCCTMTETVVDCWKLLFQQLVTRNSSGDERANVNFFLRRHRARTTTYNRLVHKFRHRSTRLCVGMHVFTKFSEIMQYNGHYVVQGHSRSPILVPIQSLYIYDFLLVINTNLPPILHRFQVMADYSSNFCWREGVPNFVAIAWSDPLPISP